jgi:hypothetical protein
MLEGGPSGRSSSTNCWRWSITLIAQSQLNAGTAFVTAEQIVDAAGTDADATDVTAVTLGSGLPRDAPTPDGTVFTIASQLRAEWLPDRPPVGWVRCRTPTPAPLRAVRPGVVDLLEARGHLRGRLSLTIGGGKHVPIRAGLTTSLAEHVTVSLMAVGCRFRGRIGGCGCR